MQYVHLKYDLTYIIFRNIRQCKKTMSFECTFVELF